MLVIMMSGKTLYKQISTNDHLSTTATSVSFLNFDGQSIHWLLFTPLYNDNSHQSASTTAKLK